MAKNQVTWLKPDLFKSEKTEKIPEQPPVKVEDTKKEENQKKIQQLVEEDQKLVKMITKTEDQVAELTNEINSEFNFLTYNDIKNITNGKDEKEMIAITAPPDMQIEVLDKNKRGKIINEEIIGIENQTDENSKLMSDILNAKQQVYLSATKGKIGIYMIANSKEKEEVRKKEEFPSPNSPYRLLDYNMMLFKSRNIFGD